MTQSMPSKRGTLRERNRARSLAALLTACALVGAAACGTDQPSDKRLASSTASSPSPTPTTAPADPSEQTKSQLIALYRAYWDETERAYAAGTTKGTRLSEYAAGVAMASTTNDIAGQRKAGQVAIGEVAIKDSVVTAIDLDRKVPSATLASCLDIAQWELMDRTTRAKVDLPDERLTKFVMTSTFEKWPEGWRVVRDEPQSKAC